MIGADLALVASRLAFDKPPPAVTGRSRAEVVEGDPITSCLVAADGAPPPPLSEVPPPPQVAQVCVSVPSVAGRARTVPSAGLGGHSRMRILPPRCGFEWIMHASVGGWFAGVFPGRTRCASAVRTRPPCPGHGGAGEAHGASGLSNGTVGYAMH